MFRSTVIACALWLASPAGASAHDVWLTLDGDAAARRVIVNYGHPDDRPPVLPDKIVDLLAIGANETMSLLPGLMAAQEQGVPAAVSAPFADDGRSVFAARYDNGYWAKTPDGSFRNATRRLMPGASERVWSGKFAKAVSGAGAPWFRVLGHELEIVPLSDPAAVRPGETLRLRVLFRGQPLAGAEVERGDGTTKVAEKDIPRFATGADGVASIPIVEAGPQLLVIDHRVTPSATPDQADADLFNATLWFTTARSR